MKTYQLKNKFGETISQVRVDSFEEAVEFFSKVKNLEKKELLEIYKIEKK